jgi:hypothetical protein
MKRPWQVALPLSRRGQARQDNRLPASSESRYCRGSGVLSESSGDELATVAAQGDARWPRAESSSVAASSTGKCEMEVRGGEKLPLPLRPDAARPPESTRAEFWFTLYQDLHRPAENGDPPSQGALTAARTEITRYRRPSDTDPNYRPDGKRHTIRIVLFDDGDPLIRCGHERRVMAEPGQRGADGGHENSGSLALRGSRAASL